MGVGKFPDVVNGYKWELYNIADDYSENNDLAAKIPDKLQANCRNSSWWKRQDTRCSRWTIRSCRDFSPRSRVTPPGEPSSLTRAN